MHLTNTKILVVQGARNVGKTQLLRQIETILKEMGHDPKYFNVLRERFNPIFATPESFYQYLTSEKVVEKGKRGFVLLDNAAMLPEAKKFLDGLHAVGKESLKIIIATTTKIIQRSSTTDDITDAELFTYHPTSWREFVGSLSDISENEFFSIDQKKDVQGFFKAHKETLESLLPQFALWGGYPEVVEAPIPDDRREALHQIFDEYIHKDVMRILRPSSVPPFVSFLQTIAAHPGELVNVNTLASQLDVHKKTIEKFIEVSRNTFLLSFVTPFYTDARREMSKMSRGFVNDPGMLSFLTNRTHLSYGEQQLRRPLILNMVYTELMKRRRVSQVQFYRTIAKAEIDFIANVEGSLLPCLISYYKYRDTVPVVIKNFVKKYEDRTRLPIIVTKDDLRFEKDGLFIPLTILPYIDFTTIPLSEEKKIS